MKITIFKEVQKFTITSAVSKEDFDLLRKYNPSALVLKDKDGNQIFAIGEGNDCLASFGVTFGGTTAGGNLKYTGTIPADLGKQTPAEYVADLVGCCLDGLKAIEENIPAAATAVRTSRASLISGIAEV